MRDQRRPPPPRLLRRQRRRHREHVADHDVRPKLLHQRHQRQRRVRRRGAIRRSRRRRREGLVLLRRREPEALRLDRLPPVLPRLDQHLVPAPPQRPRQGDRRKGVPRVSERRNQEPSATSLQPPLRAAPPRSPQAPPRAIPSSMRRRDRNPAERLRFAVEALPTRTREAMLKGIDSNPIIVGAYVDRDGGVCPMLAAHRNGGRTSLASFARAWDRYTGAKRPRLATRRELRTLRSLLEASLSGDDLDRARLDRRGGRPDSLRAGRDRRARGARGRFGRARDSARTRRGPHPGASTPRHRRAPPGARAPRPPALVLDAARPALRGVPRPARRGRGAARRATLRGAQPPSCSSGRVKTISGTRHAGDVLSRNRTDSAMSSGRIISSGFTCSLTNSVIGVSTNPGQNAVT